MQLHPLSFRTDKLAKSRTSNSCSRLCVVSVYCYLEQCVSVRVCECVYVCMCVSLRVPRCSLCHLINEATWQSKLIANFIFTIQRRHLTNYTSKVARRHSHAILHSQTLAPADLRFILFSSTSRIFIWHSCPATMTRTSECLLLFYSAFPSLRPLLCARSGFLYSRLDAIEGTKVNFESRYLRCSHTKQMSRNHGHVFVDWFCFSWLFFVHGFLALSPSLPCLMSCFQLQVNWSISRKKVPRSCCVHSSPRLTKLIKHRMKRDIEEKKLLGPLRSHQQQQLLYCPISATILSFTLSGWWADAHLRRSICSSQIKSRKLDLHFYCPSTMDTLFAVQAAAYDTWSPSPRAVFNWMA